MRKTRRGTSTRKVISGTNQRIPDVCTDPRSDVMETLYLTLNISGSKGYGMFNYDSNTGEFLTEGDMGQNVTVGGATYRVRVTQKGMPERYQVLIEVFADGISNNIQWTGLTEYIDVACGDRDQVPIAPFRAQGRLYSGSLGGSFAGYYEVSSRISEVLFPMSDRRPGIL